MVATHVKGSDSLLAAMEENLGKNIGSDIQLSGQCIMDDLEKRYVVQRGASDHSQGFEDKNFGSSPGLLGQWVATVAAHQPGELPKFSSSNPSE